MDTNVETSSPKNILELENINVEFRGIRALTEVSLNVREGEILGLMGPNGAGKTTLLNAISGLISLKTGVVRLNGDDISKVPPHKRALMGIARSSQGISLCDYLTVMENLQLRAWLDLGNGPLVKSVFNERVKDEHDYTFRKKIRSILKRLDAFRVKIEGDSPAFLLKKVEGRAGFADTADIVNTIAAALPFASKKRIEFARTLAGNPCMLLLDEPTAGLQQAEAAEFGSYLAELRDTLKLPVVIVEHNVKFLNSICDRVAVLNFGQKIFDGPPAEAMQDARVKEVYLGTSVEADSPDSAKSNVVSIETVLEMKNVTLRYGPVEALSDVSLNMKRGEIVSVLGLNGAGKSTLLKSIAGVERPLAGEIICGSTSLKLGEPESSFRKGIRMLPETARIFPDLTVLENLKMVRTQKKTKVNWREFLERYFPVLLEKLELKGGDLSGGQQQMLALAQAFLSKPDILLLDEPSLGLAPKIVTELFQLIRRLGKDEGTSILLVEQNVFATLRISDRAYIIEGGRIVKSGTREELLEDKSIAEHYFGSTA